MNVNFIEVKNPIAGTIDTYAIIDRGNGEYTSMPKAIYEATLVTESAPTA